MPRVPLKEARIERGLTQTDMARLLDVSYTSYTQWESGKRKINERSKVAILNVLKCKPKDVFFPVANDPRTLRKIILTNGGYAKVDADDFEWLEQWDWQLNENGYAYRMVGDKNNRQTILMHREILKTPDDMISDHINGNKTDNRKKNLRVVNHEQNARNRFGNHCAKSKYKGVSVYKGRYGARIRLNGKVEWLGLFDNEIDAALAYNKAASEAWGEYAKLNKIK